MVDRLFRACLFSKLKIFYSVSLLIHILYSVFLKPYSEKKLKNFTSLLSLLICTHDCNGSCVIMMEISQAITMKRPGPMQTA